VDTPPPIGSIAPANHHHHHHASKPKGKTTSTATPVPTVTVTITSSGVPTNPPGGSGATNLALTPTVTDQLVAAGAATHQLPAKDFTGLVPGRSYYALDSVTSTYWAAAGLVPKKSSQAAQIAVQDDGSYLVFTRKADGAWTGYNVGLAGVAGSSCQIAVPKPVLAVWGWEPHSCRPPD
jgi:hypothetical protein